MYKNFRAENFRGLLAVELKDLATINLITGLNDAGKTSLLEAMFLHASGPLAGNSALQVIRSGRGQDFTISNNPTEYGPWANLFSNFDTSKSINLEADTSQGFYKLQLTEGHSEAAHTISAPTSSGANAAPLTNSLKIIEKKGKSPSKTYTQSVNLNVNAALSNPAMALDIRLDPPAQGPFMRGALVKGSLGPDLAQGYSDLRKQRGAVDLLETLQEIDNRIVALEVLVADGRPQLHADLGAETLIPFELLGDGPVSLARCVVSMLQARDGVVFIDEIGAGLHYSVLPLVWKTLYRVASRLNVQIIATTHSDEALRALNQALINHPKDLRVYRLKRRGEASETQVSTYSDNKLAAALDMNVELR